MKKVFLNMMFGSPISWYDKYVENVTKMAKYDWHWMVFTPNDVKGSENVHIVKMDLADFDRRVKEKTGIEPHNYMDGHAPHKLTSDYYQAYGLLMEDYIKDYEFWGHTNWDEVYGRLDHFVTDEWLAKSDIWSDDPVETNGIFCLYRNNDYVKNLFRKVENWQHMFEDHTLFYFDEAYFPKVANDEHNAGNIRFSHPPYYSYHSYDRLAQHIPEPQIKEMDDGSLYEIYEDTVTGRKVGREIMFFHFSYTKKWPELLK